MDLAGETQGQRAQIKISLPLYSYSLTLSCFLYSLLISLQEPVLSADDVERLTSVSQHVNHLSVLTKVRPTSQTIDTRLIVSWLTSGSSTSLATIVYVCVCMLSQQPQRHTMSCLLGCVGQVTSLCPQREEAVLRRLIQALTRVSVCVCA